MANTANDASIRREEAGPDYVAAINLVRGKLRANDSDQRSLAQDNATLYTRIEKQHGVHKGAAKTFASIDKMAQDKRTDFLRSLFGLLGFAGYDNFDDLVDRAQRPSANAKPDVQPKPAPDAEAGPEGKNGDIARPDVDPAIEAQRKEDAAAFEEGGNVHKLPGAKGKTKH